MKAIVFEAPRRLRLVDDAPMPEPGDGELLVRCTHVALCGSNMGPYTGDGCWIESPRPSAPGWSGHENVGVVAASRHPDWPEGARVLAVPKAWDGFAEYFVATPGMAVRLPDDTADPGALVVAQPLATVLRGFSRLPSPVGQVCAVVGQGPIGLMFTFMLSRMCARRVIVADPVPDRLAWARRFGAGDTLETRGMDLADAVRSLTGGRGADLVVDASGDATGLQAAARCVRHSGTLVPFGCQDDDATPFPWLFTNRNHTNIVASNGCGGAAWLQAALDLLLDGRAAPLAELAMPRMPWHRAVEAFEMYADPAGNGGALKITLELPEGG